MVLVVVLAKGVRIVVELHIVAAVSRFIFGTGDRYGPEGKRRGLEREDAVRINLIDHVHTISGAVKRMIVRIIGARGVENGMGRVVLLIPTVVEAVVHMEAIRLTAALRAFDDSAGAREREIGVAEMVAVAAIMRGEAYLNKLTHIIVHIQADERPVSP